MDDGQLAPQSRREDTLMIFRPTEKTTGAKSKCLAAMFAFWAMSATAGRASANPNAVELGSHPCANGGRGEPAPNEVFVFVDGQFGGTCAALFPGFYPNAGTAFGGFGIPNDQLSSLKVGSGVRARLFHDGVFAGSWIWYGPGDVGVIANGWNDQVSSIRVEDNARSLYCNDLQAGEFAVFRDANLNNDCVVLNYEEDVVNRYPGAYQWAPAMGIADNSISSALSGPSRYCGYGTVYWTATLSDAQNCPTSGPAVWISSSSPSFFDDFTTYGMNDRVSSIYGQSHYYSCAYSYDTLAFDQGDNRLYTGDGDWAQNEFKGECASTEWVVGVSASGTQTHSIQCASTLGNDIDYVGVQSTLDISSVNYGYGTHNLGDWDSGYIKGECPLDSVVTGLSLGAGGALDHVRCGSTFHNATNCRALLLPDQEDQGSGTYWALNDLKAECSGNTGYPSGIAGVSRSVTTGDVHAVMCCNFSGL